MSLRQHCRPPTPTPARRFAADEAAVIPAREAALAFLTLRLFSQVSEPPFLRAAGWGGTADREAVAGPEMTLAAGNALCDVKLNYFWEKCQPGPNELELCRQSCRLASSVLDSGVQGALGTGFGGGAPFQTWHLCGACGCLKPLLQALVALAMGMSARGGGHCPRVRVQRAPGPEISRCEGFPAVPTSFLVHQSPHSSLLSWTHHSPLLILPRGPLPLE